jgi:hypothetical protein
MLILKDIYWGYELRLKYKSKVSKQRLILRFKFRLKDLVWGKYLWLILKFNF